MNVSNLAINVTNMYDQLIELVINYGPKVLLSLITLLIGNRLIKLATKTLEKLMTKKSLDSGIVSFTTSVTNTLLKVLLLLSVASTLEIQTTSFIAIITALTFSIGLALQGSLSNFAGGVLILIFKPFILGDYINGGGFSGTVSKIQIFNTILSTPDNKKIIIPNSQLSNSGVTNFSAMETRRVDLTFGVDYDSDIKKVRDIIYEVGKKHELVLQDPEPFVRMSNLGDSSIDFVIRAWTKTANYWTVHFDLLEQVKLRFDEENISIPYPHIEVVQTKQNVLQKPQ